MKDTHYTTTVRHDMVWCRSIYSGNYDRNLSSPLGLTQGLYAIILGHIIGGILLFGLASSVDVYGKAV